MQFAKSTKLFVALTATFAFVGSTAAFARGGGGHGGGGHGGGGHSVGGVHSGGWGNTNFGSVNGGGPHFTPSGLSHGGYGSGRGYGYGYGRGGYGYGYGYGNSGAAYNDGSWGNGPEWGNGGGGYMNAGYMGGGMSNASSNQYHNISAAETVKTYSWPDSHGVPSQTTQTPYIPSPAMSASDTKATQSTLDGLIRDTNRF